MNRIVLVLLAASLLLPAAACQGRRELTLSSAEIVAQVPEAAAMESESDVVVVADTIGSPLAAEPLTEFISVEDEVPADPAAVVVDEAADAARLLAEARQKAALERQKREAFVQSSIERAREAASRRQSGPVRRAARPARRER